MEAKKKDKRFVAVYRGHKVSDEEMEALIHGRQKTIALDITDAKGDAKAYRWITAFEKHALYLAVECVSKQYGKHTFQVAESVTEHIVHARNGRKYIDCNVCGEFVIV